MELTRNSTGLIAEGQLIFVKNLPNKQAYNKGQSNFWFDEQKKILHFREGQKKDKSIQLTYQNQQYQYEGVTSPNIYEVIVRTSIFSLLFGGTSPHVAVTEESLRLPFEQQPWFIGAVDKNDVKKLEQAQTRMFFTRAKGPKVYLHWTRSKSSTSSAAPILLESNDLSLVLPRGEFILAIHNGGMIKHYNEVLFCRRVMENDMEGAKIRFDQGVNLNSHVLHEPNLLTYYIKHTPQQLQSSDMILWLLKLNGGVFIDRNDATFINVVASHSSDQMIEMVLEHGISNNPSVTKRAISRTIPPHRLRVYFQTLMQACRSTEHDAANAYLESVKEYEDRSTKAVLVLCAWQFGNEDNLFKQLPKEIVQHIISYGVEDDHPWLDYLDPPDILLSKSIAFTVHSRITFSKIIKLAIIAWHYRDDRLGPTLIEAALRSCIENWSIQFYDNLTPHQMKSLVSWIIKLSSYCQLTRSVYMESPFMEHLITNHNSTPHVIALLDSHTFNRYWWLKPRHKFYYKPIPLSWTVLHSNSAHKSLIEFLIKENLLPEHYTTPSGQIVSLKFHIEHLNGNPVDINALNDFIEEVKSRLKQPSNINH